MPRPDSVFVRLPNWVGDACMCLPALSLLRQAGLPLVLCGRPWAQDLLAGLEPAGFVPIAGSLGAGVRAVRQSLGGGRHFGLIFTNSFSSAALFRLAGLRSAGYRGDGRGLLLAWPQAKAGGHEVEVFYQLARGALERWQPAFAAPPHPGPRLALPMTARHRQAADRVLRDAGIGGPFVLLAPIATGLHHGRPKAWPHFKELSLALHRQGIPCVVCPPPHEVESTRQAAPGAVVLPSLGLGAFAALTLRARVVVCNDSGTSHVAAAAGARQITLFGVTARERTGPWSPDAICLGSADHWPSLQDVLSTLQQPLS